MSCDSAIRRAPDVSLFRGDAGPGDGGRHAQRGEPAAGGRRDAAARRRPAALANAVKSNASDLPAAANAPGARRVTMYSGGRGATEPAHSQPPSAGRRPL